MKRIVVVFLWLFLTVKCLNAQTQPVYPDSTLMVASTSSDDKILIEARVFCEKNDNGVKKYYTSTFNQAFVYEDIMYHLVPGVTSISVELKIADTFDLKDIRYSVIEGIDSVRSSNQQFTQVKHEDGFHVSKISGVECSQKTIMVEVYNVRLQMILMRVMLRTDTKIPKPELAFFAYTKDSVCKDLFNETLSEADAVQSVGFLKTNIHPVVLSMDFRQPGLIPFFWPGSGVIGMDVDKFFRVIDIALANDSLTKAMYAKGFRYKISGNQHIVNRPGIIIRINSVMTAIKDGKIEYKAVEVLSKKSKLRFTGKKILLLVLSYSLPFIILFAVIYSILKRKNKRQKQKLEQQNEITRLKLQGVRSQLNPHFVFNALAGIQNLMNKQETEKASNYLAAFSRITRSVLDNSAKELITVDEEVKLLTDYLQMEQLRFGFKYNIEVDEEVDKHNIEIPAMLLQPFVENAVKHGIASLKENGYISVRFEKINNDLQLSITDNGKGFDSGKDYNGLGLQLSKSRVALLNTVYKTTPAHLNIEADRKGTKVTITLNNWI